MEVFQIESCSCRATLTAVATTVAEQKKVPQSGGYPSFRDSTESWKPFAGISGGGDKAPEPAFPRPDWSNAKQQAIARDPEFYKAAAQQRLAKGKPEFAFDDGLTVLERKQISNAPAFLTGSAKTSLFANKEDIETGYDVSELTPMDKNKIQLAGITFIGLLAMVGCLSGTVEL